MFNLIILISLISFSLGCASVIENITGYPSIETRQKYIASHPDLDNESKNIILKGSIFIGMTKEQVLASWGKPDTINKTISSNYESEQWIYPHGYLYFEKDILKTYQD